MRLPSFLGIPWVQGVRILNNAGFKPFRQQIIFREMLCHPSKSTLLFCNSNYLLIKLDSTKNHFKPFKAFLMKWYLLWQILFYLTKRLNSHWMMANTKHKIKKEKVFCVCACVCVWERERDSVCVCVCKRDLFFPIYFLTLSSNYTK